jgi:hypothetical protein
MNPSKAAKPTVFEPQRNVPLDAVCDVVVAGGGIAGVAAAIAAAREGVSVILMEKQFGLGGLATLGHVVKYLPLCDGYGKQVMGGLAEELLQRSVMELKGKPLPSAGFVPVPDCWTHEKNLTERERQRFMTSFNPYAFQMEIETALEDAGVTLMYDTCVCQVLKDGEKISHVIVENKSGRLAIQAGAFVDASGDADLAYYAGCAVENYTANVLASWYYEIKDGKTCLVSFTNRYDRQHQISELAVGPFFSGTDHRDVTRQVVESRKLLRARLRQKQEENPGVTIHAFALPSIPDLRITRRLHNRFSLGEQHRHVWMDDSVGITGDWRKKGPIYPLPLSSIHSDTCANLFVTGRCMSSDKTVIDVTRAIGTCAVTGQAGGVAASFMVKNGITSRRELSVAKLQDLLRKQGALIHPDLVKAHPGALEKLEAA